MTDAFRSKLNLILVAAVTFAIGLGVAGALDLTPRSLASGRGEGLALQVGAPERTTDIATHGMEAGFADIAEQLTPAVVTVEVEKEVSAGVPRRRQLPPPFDRMFPDVAPDAGPRTQEGSGSGFIVTPDGYIVTNNHVVEGADRITVRLSDGRVYENVKLVGHDATTDVALIKLKAEGLPTAPLGHSDRTRVGEWVLAIGSPGYSGGTGLLYTSVTAGIVSAKGRFINIIGRQFARRGEPSPAIEDFIQTDAVINPGNSGGPLVNARGEVIGMNTAIASNTGYYQGYGFAVPIDLVRQVIDEIKKYGEVRRAVLGVTVLAVDANQAEFYDLDKVAGVIVSDYSAPAGEKSPAERAGILPGDVIVAVNDTAVSTVGDLQRKIRAHSPGDTVTLEVVRRSTRKTEKVRVKLASAKGLGTEEPHRLASASRSNILGLEVEPISDEARRALDLPPTVQGALISKVAARGPAARARIEPNLIIEDVNGVTVRSPGDFRRIVSKLKPGQVVSMMLYIPQDERRLPISLRLPSD